MKNFFSMLNIMRSFFILVTLLACARHAAAQQDVLAGRDSSVFENERIERVEIHAKPVLEMPEIPNVAPERGLTYVSPDLKYKPAVPPAKMIPMEQDKPTWDRLYNHYAKLGLGLWLSPMAKVYLNSGREINKSWGLRYEHFSTPTGHTGFANFGDHRAGLQGRLLQPMTTVYTDVDFRYYKYNFYGMQRLAPESVVSDDQWRDSIRQHFIQFSALVGLKSNYTAGKLRYDAPLKVEFFGDRRDGSEWYVNLTPSIELPVYDSLYFRLTSRFTVGGASTARTTGSRTFVDVTPQLAWYNSMIRARAGLRANLYADSAGSEFNIYPAVDAEFILLPPYLTVFAAATGQTQFNRRMDWMQDNPWLSPEIAVAPTFEKYRATVGLRGSILRFSWEVQGYMRQARRQAMFFSPNADSLLRRAGLEQGMFYSLYEPDFREAGGSVQLQYDPATNVRAGLKIDVRSFTLDSLTHYYHAAPVMAQANVAYGAMEKKLWLNLSLRYIGERPLGLDPEGKVEQAPGFFDVNLGADYRLSKRFSIFAEVNNLLNQSYYRWRYYVERPLDLRAGVTLAF